eukprot:3362719-Amphidinium_carterae.1
MTKEPLLLPTIRWECVRHCQQFKSVHSTGASFFFEPSSSSVAWRHDRNMICERDNGSLTGLAQDAVDVGTIPLYEGRDISMMCHLTGLTLYISDIQWHSRGGIRVGVLCQLFVKVYRASVAASVLSTLH